MNGLTRKLIYIWFFITACEAPLRYALYHAGFPIFIYLKDAFLVAIFLYFVIRTAFSARMNRLLLVLLAVILYGIVVGLFNGLALLQVLFGAKIYLPFFIGFLAIYSFGLERTFLIRLFHVFVPIILLGLLLDLLFDLPWAGFEYEAYGVPIQAARKWWTLTLPRLSGFARASFETAILLTSLSTLYLASHLSPSDTFSRRINLGNIILLILSLAGVVLTTSKSSIVAFLFLAIFYFLINSWEKYGDTYRPISGLAVKLLLILILLAGIIPPAVALTSPTIVTDHLSSGSTIITAVSASYVERMQTMWPEALALLSSGYMFVTGRGVGGIGAAQHYFEESAYNAADNLYVYFLVDFGTIFLALFLLYLIYNVLMLTPLKRKCFYFSLFCLVLFTYGTTLNVIESPALMMTLGFMLALWQENESDRS
ncbi:MAG: O-antigen ligase family protein [Candidatus Zixiibacteriota bacterium]|nr:MAG: O-antigen ligase family protein [candidate division Zixibacteria bacterium]